MMKWVAKSISVILHPLFILNFGLFSLFKFHPYYVSKFYEEQFYTISMFIAVNTLIMPLLSVYLLKRFNFISDFAITDRKQRLMPYSVIAILLGFTSYQLYQNEVYGLPLKFMLSTIICVVINILLNIKFKVSSHAIAAGGLVGLYLFLTMNRHLSVFNPMLIGAVIAAGISAWSRLYLEAHTEKEVYTGFGIGLLVCFVGMLF
ncbi:MAG TPA: hypothetical protein VGF79_01305 [Bacteroidia bacterium]